MNTKRDMFSNLMHHCMSGASARSAYRSDAMFEASVGKPEPELRVETLMVSTKSAPLHPQLIAEPVLKVKSQAE